MGNYVVRVVNYSRRVEIYICTSVTAPLSDRRPIGPPSSVSPSLSLIFGLRSTKHSGRKRSGNKSVRVRTESYHLDQ